MMYPFLQLDDNTEIVHSEMLPNGEVKVYVEKPDEKDCFHNAYCYLPSYRWENIFGFSDEEIAKYDTDNTTYDKYSNGDNDMLVLELAAEKLWKDITDRWLDVIKAVPCLQHICQK